VDKCLAQCVKDRNTIKVVGLTIGDSLNGDLKKLSNPDYYEIHGGYIWEYWKIEECNKDF
jgi:hypothetical protein